MTSPQPAGCPIHDTSIVTSGVRVLGIGDSTGRTIAPPGGSTQKTITCVAPRGTLYKENRTQEARPPWPAFYPGRGNLAETDTAGNLTSEYIFLIGKRIVRRDAASGTVYFYLSDHLGSSNIAANATGHILNDSDFYPYGGENQVTNQLPSQHYKFTGKKRDADSGLDSFGARYYGSSMGRFSSPDPGWYLQADVRNPQSWNQYAYVLNNPLINTDPDGSAYGTMEATTLRTISKPEMRKDAAAKVELMFLQLISRTRFLPTGRFMLLKLWWISG